MDNSSEALSQHPTVRRFISDLQQELPGTVVTRNLPWWLRAAMKLPFLNTLDWDRYTQTIRKTIYLAGNWDTYTEFSQLEVLRHERIHLLQFKKYTAPLFAFLYLFIFFPIGLAYFRAKFEVEAMTEQLQAAIENRGLITINREAMKKHWVEVITGRSYLYSWPFRKTAEKWFDKGWSQAINSYTPSRLAEILYGDIRRQPLTSHLDPVKNFKARIKGY
jgi:hypothetical protein